MDFYSCHRYTGKTIKTINLGSYNYLGFAEKSGPCAQEAINGIKTFGIATCNTRVELGKPLRVSSINLIPFEMAWLIIGNIFLASLFRDDNLLKTTFFIVSLLINNDDRTLFDQRRWAKVHLVDLERPTAKRLWSISNLAELKMMRKKNQPITIATRRFARFLDNGEKFLSANVLYARWMISVTFAGAKEISNRILLDFLHTLRQYFSLLLFIGIVYELRIFTIDLLGTQKFHVELEQVLADFLGVESTVAFGMVRCNCAFIAPMSSITIGFFPLGFCNQCLEYTDVGIESTDETRLVSDGLLHGTVF